MPVADESIVAIAEEAYAFGYAMVENYRTLHAQAVDATDPRYVGGFGVYRHYSTPSGPENTDIVTPNNDTPYSWIWLDLRAEPWVVSVPAIERYYVLPFHDLYTIYAGFVGSVSTGPDTGSYLIAGPDWDGDRPAGIDGIVHSATWFVGSLTRTELKTDDVHALQAVQQSYRIEAFSNFTRATGPIAAPSIDWPAWREADHTKTVAFYELLDFILQFAPALPEDAEVRDRLKSVGIDGSGTFRVADLSDDVRAAFEAGLARGIATLADQARHSTTSIGLFGTHADMAGRYANRNLGAMKGIYGLPPSEAWYGGWMHDADGNPPIGTNAYTVTFTAETLPKVRFFWSATMYRLPERLLVANPIDRYSIGDRTPGLVFADDGALTLQFSATPPTDADGRANWLPAPEGPFTVVIRAYGGDDSMATGRYTLPQLERRR